MTVEENLELGAYLRKDKGIREDFQKVFEFFQDYLSGRSSYQVRFPVENSKCLQWGEH